MEITEEMRAKLSDFIAGFTDEGQTAREMRALFNDGNYLIDPHTAVASAGNTVHGNTHGKRLLAGDPADRETGKVCKRGGSDSPGAVHEVQCQERPARPEWKGCSGWPDKRVRGPRKEDRGWRVPMLSIYGYQAYNHYEKDRSLVIHNPLDHGSSVENILHILRPDMQYTGVEARIPRHRPRVAHGPRRRQQLRLHNPCGDLHHDGHLLRGCGNARVPEGTLHGGANIKVVRMFECMKKELHDWTDEDEVREYR